MSFDDDSVSRGSNIEKYAKITLATRKYYYDNFRKYMGINYLKYTINSLLLNILVNKYQKKIFGEYFFEAKKHKLLTKKQIFILLVLNILPSSILLMLKKIKENKKKR